MSVPLLPIDPDDLPDDRLSLDDLLAHKDGDEDKGTTIWYDANDIKNLEACAVEVALDQQLQEAARLLKGWRRFFDCLYEHDLRAFAKETATPEERELYKERDRARSRAQRIAGLILCDLMYHARALTAEQLLREMDSEGANQVALLMQEVELENPKIRD